MNKLKHRFLNSMVSTLSTYTYKTVLLTIVLMLFLTTSATVMANDIYTINQKDHKFSEMFVKIKNNDVIRFVNHDEVNHRLIFTYKGQQEQMNVIQPGKSQEVSFSQAGIYDVHCKIHPEMKLTIFIPYVAKLSKAESFYTF